MPNEMQKKLVDQKFRNIQNINLIPDNIFEQLEIEGKIDEWNEILKDKNSLIATKIQVKNEIKKYVISVRYSPLVIHDEEELFYKDSNIYRTQYTYDFNKETLKGKGLIMENINKESSYFDE